MPLLALPPPPLLALPPPPLLAPPPPLLPLLLLLLLLPWPAAPLLAAALALRLPRSLPGPSGTLRRGGSTGPSARRQRTKKNARKRKKSARRQRTKKNAWKRKKSGRGKGKKKSWRRCRRRRRRHCCCSDAALQLFRRQGICSLAPGTGERPDPGSLSGFGEWKKRSERERKKKQKECPSGARRVF